MEDGNKEKNQGKKEKNQIRISFKRKENKRLYITKNEKCKKEEKVEAAAGSEDAMPQWDGEAAAAKKDDADSLKKEGESKDSSSKTSPQSRKEELQRTTFTVLQKNMRSMSTNDRLDELIKELHQVDWM